MYNCSASRRFGCLSICLASLLLCLGTGRLEAVGTFIPATNRIDMVHDAGRDLLYITAGSQVLRHHLGSATFLPAFNLGGSLGGIDLSPDGNTLAVADVTRSASNVWIHVVDLTNGNAGRVLFPRTSTELGTFTVAFGADGAVLITGRHDQFSGGSTPLRHYDPASGTTRVITAFTHSALLCASGDRSVIAFTESNATGGPFGRYDVAGQRISGSEPSGGGFIFQIGVNRDGSQFALPSSGGTFIHNENLDYLRTIGAAVGGHPFCATYHPSADVVFFPWAMTREIRAYDTTTFQQIGSFDFEQTVSQPGFSAFGQGHLRISRDGMTLFCNVTNGVRYYRHNLNAPVYRRLAIDGDPRWIGTPTPTPYGTNWLPVAGVITNEVTSIAELDGVRYVCAGWSGTGSVPSNGTGTSVVFTLNDKSTLTWHWTPVASQLSVNVAGSGSVNSTGGWFNIGQKATLLASPASGCRFVRWFGDVPLADSTNNPIQLVMDRGRRVTALFVGQSSSEGYLPDDWPTYGRGPSHAGYVQGILGDAYFTNRWTINAGAPRQVAISQGRVFVSRITPEFSLDALDAVSGSVLWRHPFPATRALNPPAYYQGNIYVQHRSITNYSRLFSVDAVTGLLNWSASAGSEWVDHMAPTVVDEAVFWEVYGFNRSTGARLFFNDESRLGWTPAFHNGRLYAWTGGEFREHNPQMGAIRRTLDLNSSPTGEIIGQTTAAADKRAYMINRGDLFAVDLETYSLLWKKEGLGYFRGTPAIANGIVYANSNDAVVAFTAHDGEYVGTYTGTERLSSPLIVTDDIVLAGSNTRTFVFDLGTFSLRQTLPVGGQLSLADGVLYIADSGPYGTEPGRLHAFSTGQDRTLVIAGDPGPVGMMGPIGYGTNFLPRDYILTNSVLSFVQTNRTRYNCLGWTGTGNVPATGSSNQVVFTLTTNSTLTWRWQLISYFLGAGIAGKGTVNFTNGWINVGTTVTLTATPQAGHRFLRWVGDVSAVNQTNNPLALMMDRPRQVTAIFEEAGGPPLQGGWPTFGNGPSHSGYLPGALGNATFHLRWAQTLNARLQQVAVGGDRVFVTPSQFAGNNAFMGAYHVYSGKQLWHKNFFGAFVMNPPTYHDGAVFMQRGGQNTIDTDLWSFDAVTGQTNWLSTHGAEGFGRYMAPTVAEGMVWVSGGTSGGMYGFNHSNGVQRFFVRLDRNDPWTPTYHNQKLYTWVASKFREHSPLTGEVNWTLILGVMGYGDRGAVVADGGYGYVYTSGAYDTNGSRLVAVDLAARRASWHVPGLFYGFPAAANGFVYAISNSVVSKYSEQDGKFLGQFVADEALTFFEQQPIITADTLFVSSNVKTYVFDLFTFARRQTLPVTGRLSLADGVLYVAGEGVLSAYSSATDWPLLVRSNSGLYGDPSPAIYGTNLIRSGVTLTTSVTTPWYSGSGRYVNLGWTGTGSVPANGTSNAVTFPMSAASSLTWLWKTQYFLSVFVSSNGTVSSASGWHDAGTTLSLTATPSTYFHFANWDGDISGTSPTTSVVMNGTRTVLAYFAEDLATNGVPHWWLAQYGLSPDDIGALADPDADSLPNWREYAVGSHPLDGDTDGDTYGDGVEITWNSLPNNPQSIPRAQLIIEGRPAPYGNALPHAYGTNLVALFRPVTNRVISPVSGPSNSMRWISTGWTGTGLVPASGNTNQVTFVVTTNSTLTWNWATQYLLVTAGTSNGTISAKQGTNSSPDCWWISESLLTLTAVPSNYFHFANWAGELSGSNNPTSLVMDKPRFVRAIFAANMRTNGVPEWWLAEHGFPITDGATRADTDFDGMVNWQEFVAGTNPKDSSSVLRMDAWVAGANYHVSWPSTAGRTYRLLSSSNVAGPFAAVANGIAATPPLNIHQLGAASATQRFYKLEVE